MEDAPQASDGPRSTIEDKYALDALQFDWGEAYMIGRDDVRGWWAARRDRIGGYFTASGADELRAAIVADYTLKPVPRPPAGS